MKFSFHFSPRHHHLNRASFHFERSVSMINRRIRTRFKMFSKFFSSSQIIMKVLLLLMMIDLLDAQSSSLFSLNSKRNHPKTLADCPVEQCFRQKGVEGFSLDKIRCTLAQRLFQCIHHSSGSEKSCRGNLIYHTIESFITSCRKNYQQKSSVQPKPKNEPVTVQAFSSSIPQVRSGDSSPNWHQHLSSNKPLVASKTTILNKNKQQSWHNTKSNHHNQYFDHCALAAYNFTIGYDILPHNKLTQTKNIAEPTLLTSSQHHQQQFKRNIDLIMSSYFQQKNKSNGSAPSNADNKPKLNFTSFSPTNANQEMTFYNLDHQPITPSLTCIIFGDPHLRTFDSRYQTCNCLGARSLIEHPLFDVQITNTKFNDQFNSTGVTKVTVLVRRFSPCMIPNELIYETDSLAQSLPSATFTDGSVINNLVYITISSQFKVVTLHLEHIGVVIYISQFAHTKFLNVVIKFRTATSKHMKQERVLEAINPISLCKSGCRRNELINIKQELIEHGLDVEKIIQLSEDDENNEENRDENDDDYENYSNYDDISEYDTYNDQNDESETSPQIRQIEESKTKQHRLGRKKRTKKDIGEKDNWETAEKIDGRLRGKKERKNRKRNRSTTTAPTTTTIESISRRNKTKNNSRKNRDRLRAASIGDYSSLMSMATIPSEEDAEATLKQEESQISKICLEKRLIGFYRLTCLYDTVLKRIVTNDPHNFAWSFDETRFDFGLNFSQTLTSEVDNKLVNIVNEKSNGLVVITSLSLYLITILIVVAIN